MTKVDALQPDLVYNIHGSNIFSFENHSTLNEISFITMDFFQFFEEKFPLCLYTFFWFSLNKIFHIDLNLFFFSISF